MSRSLSKKTRFEVFKRDSFTCQYCGKSAPDVVLEVDHITPVSEGGDDDPMNLVTACFDCNRGKGARALSDDSAMAMRKAQLDALQERREQLEMMQEWQRMLMESEFDGVALVQEAISRLTGYEADEQGERHLLSLIHKFGLEEVREAAMIAFTQYDVETSSGWEYAFSKLGGICYNRRKQVDDA